jgi:maltose alpha-D-glucosyltransferase/alpha-amylase
LRTAELHLALASDELDPAFAPEPYTTLYQRSLYQAMRTQAVEALQLLRRRLGALSEPQRADARRVLDLEGAIMRVFRAVADRRMTALRIRVHGDYHLGQVLYTGRDFVIIDFEGEPSRTIGARRIKRTPLRDVAGMLRSFHYAAATTLQTRLPGGRVRPEDIQALAPWARFWTQWVSAAFLRDYLSVARGRLLPPHGDELKILLDAHLLEKALYELGYELGNRPDWVGVPLSGILEMMEPTA